MSTGRILIRIAMILLPIIILVIGFMAMGAMNENRPRAKKDNSVDNRQAVFVVPARLSDYHYQVEAQGEVRPKTEIDISSQVSGRVSYISPNFVDGGLVKKGELLFALDPSDYNLRQVQAKAAVAGAEQLLALRQAEADIAAEDWAILGEGTPSPLALRQPQLAEAKANLASANATLDEAELALQRTKVYAPFNGRIRAKNVDFGQFVTPGAPLGRMFSSDVVEIPLSMDHNELADTGLGLAFNATVSASGPEVQLSAQSGDSIRHWTGHVTRTSAAIDPRTRLVTAIVEVSDPFGAGSDDGAPLAPGLFVKAAIEGRSVENVIIIPRAGLRGKDKVYLADDEGKLRIRDVIVETSNRENVIITNGLAEEERVIISPVKAAFDGMDMRFIDDDGNLIPDKAKGLAAVFQAISNEITLYEERRA